MIKILISFSFKYLNRISSKNIKYKIEPNLSSPEKARIYSFGCQEHVLTVNLSFTWYSYFPLQTTLCDHEFKDNLPNPWNSHFHEPNISHQKTFPELSQETLTMNKK
jgi:hypothetical protein